MEKYLSVILKSKLFSSIPKETLMKLLGRIGAKEKSFRKGEFIYHSGEKTFQMALILNGKIAIQTDDYWGNRSIINIIGEGDLIAESYAIKEENLLNDAVAETDCTLCMIDSRKIIREPDISERLFNILAEKNMMLVRKLRYLSERTTREKVLSYLSDEAKQSGSNIIDIPFNRQGLADYLAVERSALSSVLMRMKEEGLIDYKKNHFILNPEDSKR